MLAMERETEISIDKVFRTARLVYFVLLLCMAGSVAVAYFISAFDEVAPLVDIGTKLVAGVFGAGMIVAVPLIRHFKMPPILRLENTTGTIAPGLVPKAVSESLASKYLVVQFRSWTAASLLAVLGLALLIVTASRGLFYPYIAGALALLALYAPSRRDLEGIARAAKNEG